MMSDFTNVRVQDCTLRDGGYHSNWHFSDALVNAYLKTLAAFPVALVELGYRHPETTTGHGPFGNLTEALVSSLDLPSELQYSIMLDAKDFPRTPSYLRSALNRITVPAASSGISWVRVATQVDEEYRATEVLRALADQGYQTSVSLMRATRRALPGIRRALAALLRLPESARPSVVFFADSFGVLEPADVRAITEAMRAVWPGAIGFHGHNNKGLALVNATEAARAGASWLDSTVAGMGRGAGNVPTEYLLQEVFGLANQDGLASLYRLVVEHFEPLRAKWQWGHSFIYHLGGKLALHPSFVQSIMAERVRNPAGIATAIRDMFERAPRQVDTAPERYAQPPSLPSIE